LDLEGGRVEEEEGRRRRGRLRRVVVPADVDEPLLVERARHRRDDRSQTDSVRQVNASW